jgi:hypothetical protein
MLLEKEDEKGHVAYDAPFPFLPLFNGVRGRGVLRTSPYRRSPKFVSSIVHSPAPIGPETADRPDPSC